MKRTKKIFGIALAAHLLALSGGAMAEICPSAYTGLKAEIDAFRGEMCDRCYQTAAGKTKASELKANDGKIADAIGKLTDLNESLDSWLNDNKQKISLEAHDSVADAIEAVVGCLNTVHP
ncbi:MAG: hypothetical protein ACU84J_05045 [Gammaproteobacteria bacterium]